MSRIRILLACPQMEKIDLWRSLLSQDPGLEIVDEATDPVDALLKAGSTQAAVVVIDLPQSGLDPGLYTHLLEEYPNLKVIAVSRDGSRAVRYQRGIIRSLIPDTSPQSLQCLFRSLDTEGDAVGCDLSQQ